MIIQDTLRLADALWVKLGVSKNANFSDVAVFLNSVFCARLSILLNYTRFICSVRGPFDQTGYSVALLGGQLKRPYHLVKACTDMGYWSGSTTVCCGGRLLVRVLTCTCTKNLIHKIDSSS